MGLGFILERTGSKQPLVHYFTIIVKDRTAINTRSKHENEARLHNKLLIGFGGYIGLKDIYLENGVLDGLETIRRTADREVNEEVECGPILNRQFVGWIWDDTTPVNRVHLGIMELWELEDTQIRSNEAEVRDTRFVTRGELGKCLESLEPWSFHAARAILEGQLS